MTARTTARVRVSRSGPTLLIRPPVVPWWVAVPVMAAVVLVVAGVAVMAVIA